jgi:hypothetical protein
LLERTGVGFRSPDPSESPFSSPAIRAKTTGMTPEYFTVEIICGLPRIDDAIAPMVARGSPHS